MARKQKTARAVRPNEGVEARYRKRLRALIEQMSKSTEYWISAQYRAAPPVAQDALPASEMDQRLKELSRRWIKKFKDEAKKWSTDFARQSINSTDSSFQQSLKDQGWAVNFKMTRGMSDIARAAVVENVSLIKSIPEQYFTQVEGIVMRGFTRGRDLAYITNELKSRYKVTSNRAAFIARDQSNKLTSSVIQQRREELGITRAIWVHTGAAKEPRKSHMAANGKEFDVKKGCLIDGKYIQPGEEINCGCISKSVLPF